MKYRDFRGAAGRECDVPMAIFIDRLRSHLPLGKLPPLKVLNIILTRGKIDRGMSGGMAWIPFSVSESELANMAAEIGIELADSPTSVRTEIEWEAWCYYSDYGVPFDEFVQKAEVVQKLEKAWQESLKGPKSDREEELQLRFVNASNEFDRFIDSYTNEQ